MVISIASDHAGFALRKIVVEHLGKLGHTVVEGGATAGDVPYRKLRKIFWREKQSVVS